MSTVPNREPPPQEELNRLAQEQEVGPFDWEAAWADGLPADDAEFEEWMKALRAMREGAWG